MSILSLEQLFVVLHFKNQSFIIGSIYIQPNTDKSNYDLYLNSINEIYHNYPGSNIILIGDFNLPNVLWSHYSKDNSIITPLCEASSTESSFINGLSCLHFSQFNFNFNNCNTILDLVFCNLVYLNVIDIDSILPFDPFHPALTISFPTDKTNTYLKF